MIDNIIKKVVSLLTAHSIDPLEFTQALLAFYKESDKKQKEAEKARKEAEKLEEIEINKAKAKIEKDENDYLVWGKFFGFNSIKDFEDWKDKNQKEFDFYAPQIAEFLKEHKKIGILPETEVVESEEKIEEIVEEKNENQIIESEEKIEEKEKKDK